MAKSQSVHYFNSIKVRLELTIDALITQVNESFQFHKGTIRTVEIDHDHKQETSFQFHKGTIRTIKEAP